jgi:hypothetical protein
MASEYLVAIARSRMLRFHQSLAPRTTSYVFFWHLCTVFDPTAMARIKNNKSQVAQTQACLDQVFLAQVSALSHPLPFGTTGRKSFSLPNRQTALMARRCARFKPPHEFHSKPTVSLHDSAFKPLFRTRLLLDWRHAKALDESYTKAILFSSSVQEFVEFFSCARDHGWLKGKGGFGWLLGS